MHAVWVMACVQTMAAYRQNAARGRKGVFGMVKENFLTVWSSGSLDLPESNAACFNSRTVMVSTV